MPLPINVFRVFGSRGQVYFYWQRGRNLPKSQRSKVVRIPYDPREPAFWAMAKELNEGKAPPAAKAGTFDATVELYKSNPKWGKLSKSTKESYGAYLAMMSKAWGPHLITDLTVRGAVELRDRIAEQISPNTANQVMRTLAALLKWCIGRGLLTTNVVRDLQDLDHERETTRPWPEDVWNTVVARAPTFLARMAILGRSTGQRISDLTRFRPVNRRGDGFDFTITKTRERHFVALSPQDEAIIDGWRVEPMQFYINEGAGKQMTPARVRLLIRRWQAAGNLHGANLSPHGLRALAICDARLRGLSLQEISSLFGMSGHMVERYSRHMDMEVASRTARARMDQAKNKA